MLKAILDAMLDFRSGMQLRHALNISLRNTMKRMTRCRASVDEQLPQAWLRAYGAVCSLGFGPRKIRSHLQ